MAKQILKDTGDKRMVHHHGKTRFRGCQCYGDCACMETFKSQPYSYYTIVRRANTKKQKTTIHTTLEEANERWKYLLTLPVKHG